MRNNSSELIKLQQNYLREEVIVDVLPHIEEGPRLDVDVVDDRVPLAQRAADEHRAFVRDEQLAGALLLWIHFSDVVINLLQVLGEFIDLIESTN